MKKKLMILILLIIFLLFGYGIYWWLNGGEHYYRYTFHKNHEPFTFANSTQTSSVYSDSYFKRMLSEYDYFKDYDLDQIVQDSYVIPGLKATATIENTEEQHRGICSSMTPQGVAVSDTYVFISAYCQTKEHHSVIYVLDKQTHQFVKEIVLPDLSHVGSIAYDTVFDNIWVCCHDNKAGLAYVQSFSLETMLAYDFEKSHTAITYDQSYPIVTQTRASFMTYHDNNLYVGYYQSNLSGETTVQRFEIYDNGELMMVENPMREHYDDPEEILLPNSLTVINGGVQGITQNDDTVFILTSGGSVNDSILYTIDNVNDLDGNLDARAANAITIDHLPPMAEELFLDGDTMYICFESAAYAYRARKCPHMDRILVYSLSEEES